MIEWKGLYANTPYSSANNKTQDDAVVGMQDTIYVTGPGYGGYSANVRVHNESGAVVALIPVSGGGGALSAPAPVRILDDSTTYSYSLEVVRGAVPSDDADKIVIRIVGGTSKRYPGQVSTLPDGSTSFAGPVQAPEFLDSEGNPIGGGGSYPQSINGAYPAVAEMADLVALWDFDEDTGAAKVSKVGFPYALRDAGAAQSVRDDTGPMSGHACVLNGSTNFLRLEAGLIGDLNLSKFGNECTVVALVYLSSSAALSFIAGAWSENNNDPRRQYALFFNATVYGGSKAVVGHISKTGGASPSLPYSRDLSASQSPVELGRWAVVAMTYDGAQIKSYYDCRWEPRPTYTEPGPPNGEGLTYSKNPYLFADGLNASVKLSDFSVGANRLTSIWTNYTTGKIGGLAVFKRALSQAELMRVQRVMFGSTLPAISYSYYGETYSGGLRGANNVSANWFYYFGATAQTLNIATAWRLEIQGANRFLGRAASATPSIVFDDEGFQIPLAECTKISLQTNNLAIADLVYPVIKVSGTWYASTTPIQQTVAGVSISDFTNEETHEIANLQTELWRPVTLVPGTTLSVAGAGAVLPADAKVDAIGVYSPGCTAQLIVRNLALWAPLN